MPIGLCQSQIERTIKAEMVRYGSDAVGIVSDNGRQPIGLAYVAASKIAHVADALLQPFPNRCVKLDARQQKQKAPLAGAKYQGGTLPSRTAAHSPMRHATGKRFELICGQIWQNKCKHFGDSRCTYTSRQYAYPSM